MKKALLALAVACAGLSVNSQAQTIMLQDFETPTVVPALPSSWSQNSPGASPGWVTGTSSTAGTGWAALTGYYNIPAHGQFAVVDDAAHTPNLHDTLKSAIFDVTSYSGVWLNYDYYFYAAELTASGISEHCYVLGSSDGGTTWALIDSVPGNAFDGTDTWAKGHANLGSLTGSNCMVAFAYTDGGASILGCALDNITVVNLPTNDEQLNAISYNNIAAGVSVNGQQVIFQITNNGASTITSTTVYYTINGGTPVSQSFTGLSVAPYTSSVLGFTTPFAGVVAGTNNLHMAITDVNGAANQDADTVVNSSFVMAASTPQRNGLIEEFSSSTCNPCHAFNQYFDPLVNGLSIDVPATHVNIIKYQMNWPDWDNDRSYNGDGLDRRNFYGVSGIPEHFVNGVVDNYNWSYPFTSADNTYFTNEVNGSDTMKAYMDMSATYTVDTIRKKMSVTVTVTPRFTVTGGTFHVHIAVADKHYQNICNEWGQLDYYNVMRKMFPNGNGTAVTSWTNGVAQTFSDTGISYTNGDYTKATTTPGDTATYYPAQMSNEFWNNPLLGSELIAFVQEDQDGSMMQSIVADPTSSAAVSHTAVSTLSGVYGMSIYPNPTKDVANLQFDLANASNVNVKIMDLAGRTISVVADNAMNAGNQKMVIPTSDMTPGIYMVVVTTDGGSNIVRLTVEK